MSSKTDTQLLGRASMMATDIINGVSYHTDQVREVLAKAYIELLQAVADYRNLHEALMGAPNPVTNEDWRRAHAAALESWPKCEHGVLKAADGKVWCTRCLHVG